MAIHFVYERVTTMHKILHILSAAIHFLWGGEHNAYHALIHASLCTGKERSNDTAKCLSIMKSVKLNYGYGA